MASTDHPLAPTAQAAPVEETTATSSALALKVVWATFRGLCLCVLMCLWSELHCRHNTAIHAPPQQQLDWVARTAKFLLLCGQATCNPTLPMVASHSKPPLALLLSVSRSSMRTHYHGWRCTFPCLPTLPPRPRTTTTALVQKALSLAVNPRRS